MQKSRKHVLTCWRQNKASKGYVASRGRLSLVKALKWGICELVLNMCILGSAPLLERWRILEMAAHYVERWRTLVASNICVGIWIGYGRCGRSSSHTWHHLFSHLVRPPSLSFLITCYIYKHYLLLLASLELEKNSLL